MSYRYLYILVSPFTDILLHWTLLFSCTCITDYTDTLHLYFIYLSSLHGYSTLRFHVIVVWITYIHALIISIFLLHGSLPLLHGLLLHVILVFLLPDCLNSTLLFSVPDIGIDIIILLLRYTGN